jgi:hypothetical protein
VAHTFRRMGETRQSSPEQRRHEASHRRAVVDHLTGGRLDLGRAHEAREALAWRGRLESAPAENELDCMVSPYQSGPSASSGPRHRRRASFWYPAVTDHRGAAMVKRERR